MRPIPLLLRVLLCIAFVVNGAAGAQAAVRMAALHAGAPTHTALQTGAASCHGAASAADQVDAAAAAAHASPQQGDGKDARCDGLCAPSAVQAPAAFVLVPPTATTRLRPDVHDHGRMPPRLPHDLRPPIG